MRNNVDFLDFYACLLTRCHYSFRLLLALPRSPSIFFHRMASVLASANTVVCSVNFDQKYVFRVTTRTKEQMSGPDLHAFTLKCLAQKNWFFPHEKYFPIILCNFSVRTLKYFQNNFVHKNGPQKLLIIGPNHFIL